MTAHKHLKQLVRARMEKTGESYATARRQVVGKESTPAPNAATRAHFPGNVATITALRVLLTHAGIVNPETGRPFTEAMLFGITGGIGVEVLSFHHELADFSLFFVAGRHKWFDDLAYLRSALGVFGIEPLVRERISPRKAARDLAEVLERGPCIAWVDRALLPHRAPYGGWRGAYDFVTVYQRRPDLGDALIGDPTDEPISLPLDRLLEARSGVKKHEHRLLSIDPHPVRLDIRSLVRHGLQNGVRELLEPRMNSSRRNFQLGAIRVWAERMEGSSDKEAWEKTYPRGQNFWRGLTSVYDCIEHYGTGGGLCRTLFADFLAEAALAEPALTPLAERYARLGSLWSELAEAALPEDVPLLSEGRRLLARKAELLAGGGPPDEIGRLLRRFTELEAQADADFPLSESECRELRAGLKRRLLAIADQEEAAFAELRRLAGV